MTHLKAHTHRHKGLSAEPEGTAVSNCTMPSIVTVTGTFGAESLNGVGRFLEGLHDWSRSRRYSLDVFSAGAHLPRSPRLHNVHALDFAVPGFEGLAAFYPLEGRRRQLARAIKDINPDIVHISTPEALGATALAIAQRQRRLVAGIYHTDFPAFARQLVQEALAGSRSTRRPGPAPRSARGHCGAARPASIATAPHGGNAGSWVGSAAAS